MRFLVVVLGLAVVAYLGYRSMYGHSGANSDGTPRQRLENVQNAANRIEQQQEEAAKRALEKANTN